MRTPSVLAAILVMGSVTLAQPRRPARSVAAARDAGAAVTLRTRRRRTPPPPMPRPTPPAPPQRPDLLLPRVVPRWQYAWRTEVECSAERLPRASPDHR
ncbi:MAG: hypothetical protein U0325_36670 [Polyangiales bacterium]